jgi:hypothetical protein
VLLNKYSGHAFNEKYINTDTKRSYSEYFLHKVQFYEDKKKVGTAVLLRSSQYQGAHNHG